MGRQIYGGWGSRPFFFDDSGLEKAIANNRYQLPGLFCENQAVGIRRDIYVIAGLELAVEQFEREGIKEFFLDRPFQGSGPELWIVAFSGKKPLRAAIQVHDQLLLRETMLQSLQLNIHNRGQLFGIEAVEDNYVVDPIEEFGTKMPFQFHPDAMFHLVMIFGGEAFFGEIFLDDR